MSLEDVVIGSFGHNVPLFNNASQDLNHTYFWKWMKPHARAALPGTLERQGQGRLRLDRKMKEEFIAAGVGQFGSGWCWLAVKDGKIIVIKTPNGENPLVHGAKPILGCDVGTRLLHRLSQSQAGLHQGVSRPPRELGICR